MEQGLEVEPQSQAGIVVAALQVEHFQGVGGVAGEGVGLLSIHIKNGSSIFVLYLGPLSIGLFPGGLEQILQIEGVCTNTSNYPICLSGKHCINIHLTVFLREAVGFPTLPHSNITGGKVNHTIDFAVDAAQIQHQHVIHKYPHIIVTGERKSHRLLAVSSVDHTIIGLAEIYFHSHA